MPTWPKLNFLLEAVEPLGGEMGASSTDDEKTEPAPAGHWPLAGITASAKLGFGSVEPRLAVESDSGSSSVR